MQQTSAEPLVAEHLSALFGLLSRSHAVDGPVSRGEYAVLALTAKLGPQRACDLADAAGLDPSTTSRRVSSLVERGFLERRADPHDGRAHRIGLTDTGSGVLAGARARRVELVGVALDDWAESDRAALADLLGRLETSLARVAEGTTDVPVRSVAGSAPAASPAASPERTLA
ncbi:MarR family winged helix-turn-helix transcriptional regulator [Phycicoccus duodecadis]|nr:MarR family winged helix-turn-helix transcriptional regulator [Phycicoccus duodecadis]